jgi:repressor LexA
MLTRRQHELLCFIDDRLKQTGISPSFDEMKDALRVRSKAGIHRLVAALEERGFLTRRRNRARALEVLRLPQDLAARTARIGPARPVSAEAGGRGEPIGFPGGIAVACRADCTGVTQVPLHGRIAAGTAVEAPHDRGDHLAVPAALLPDGAQEHYALEVAGDSMRDAGILDGDMVIIRCAVTVESGTIAVASVSGDATLKRVVRRGGDIRLEPANARYPTRTFPAEMVTVQGQLVALLRRY